MMTTIVEVFLEVGLTVSEKEIETVSMPAQDKQSEKLGVKAARQECAQTGEAVSLEGSITETLNLTVEVSRCCRLAW